MSKKVVPAHLKALSHEQAISIQKAIHRLTEHDGVMDEQGGYEWKGEVKIDGIENVFHCRGYIPRGKQVLVTETDGFGPVVNYIAYMSMLDFHDDTTWPSWAKSSA